MDESPMKSEFVLKYQDFVQIQQGGQFLGHPVYGNVGEMATCCDGSCRWTCDASVIVVNSQHVSGAERGFLRWADISPLSLTYSGCDAAIRGVLGRPQAILVVFGHSTCPRLPGELPGTSQLKCFPRALTLLRGGHSWKRQRPFNDHTRDDDDIRDDSIRQYTTRNCCSQCSARGQCVDVFISCNTTRRVDTTSQITTSLKDSSSSSSRSRSSLGIRGLHKLRGGPLIAGRVKWP